MAPPPAREAPLLGARRLGWLLVLHPAFRGRLLDLACKVEERRERGAPGWEGSPQAKLLKRVIDLVTAEIPKNPAAPEYEQGNTLGADARGWRRAKFLGRFRLFFRFDSRSKVIVYAWVNDENTLRKAGSSTDPYVVFREKLIAGDPPHGWNALLDACKAAGGLSTAETIWGAVPEQNGSTAPAGRGALGRRLLGCGRHSVGWAALTLRGRHATGRGRCGLGGRIAQLL